MKFILAAIMIFLFTGAIFAQHYTITVTITDLRSNSGNLYVNVFNSDKGFPKEPSKAFKRLSLEIKDNVCIAVFDSIPKGEYAIACYHDENSNKKMDTNFLGIPSEGTAASNNAEGFLGPPKFDDAKFLVNENVNLTIKMEY